MGGSLKHETPEPYVWDESFKVDYSRLDEEHDVLFANILAVSQHPDDAAKLQVLKDNMEKHFDLRSRGSAVLSTTTASTTRQSTTSSGWCSRTLRCLLAVRRSTGPRTGWPSTSRTLTTSTRQGWSTPRREPTFPGPFPERMKQQG